MYFTQEPSFRDICPTFTKNPPVFWNIVALWLDTCPCDEVLSWQQNVQKGLKVLYKSWTDVPVM